MGRSRQETREGGEETQRQVEQLAARGDFERAALLCLQAFDEQNDLEWLEKADNLYLTANNRLQAALVRRKMGETRIELQQWTEGENDLKHYLKTAKELRDQHEQQRALTTLGRFYLEHSRSTATTSLRINSLQKADKYCKEALAAVQRIVSCSRDERVKMRLGVLRNQFLIKQELVDAEETNSEAVQETLEVLDKYEKLAFNEGFKQDKFDVLLQKGVFLSKIIHKHKEAIENLDKAVSLWVTFKNRMGQKEAKDKLRDVLIELSAALVRAKNFRRAHDAHLAMMKHCSHIDNPKKDDSRGDIGDEESNDDNQLNSLYCLRKIAEASESLSSHSHGVREQVKYFELIADMLTDLQSFPSQALEYYKRAFTLAEKHSENNKENTSTRIDEKPLLESMASSAMDMGDYNTAYNHFTNLLPRFKGNNLKLHKLFKLMLECIDKDTTSNKDERMEQVGELARDVFEKEGNKSKMFHVLALQFVIASYLETRLKETMESQISISATKHDLDTGELKDFVENMDIVEVEESDEDNPDKIEFKETDIKKINYFYPEQMANLLQLANNDDDSIRRQHFRPVRNEKGETRLHTKCQKPGNETEIQALIAQGYNVNDSDNGGFKPLQEAAVNGHFSYIKILVEHGAKVNAQSDSGETALIDAAANGFFDIALYLLDKGAKPELQDNDGWTALCHLQNYSQRKSKEMTKEEMSICDEVGARMQVHFDKLSQSGQTIFMKEKKEKSTIFADSDDFLEEDCKISGTRNSNITKREPRKRKRREKDEPSLSLSLPKRVVRERNDDWIEATIASVDHEDENVFDNQRESPTITETKNRNTTCVKSKSSYDIGSRSLSTSLPSPAAAENIAQAATISNVQGEDVSGSVAAPSPSTSSSARVSLGSFRIRARIEGRVLVVPVATPTSDSVSHLSSLILERFVAAQNRAGGCNVPKRLPRQLRLVCGGAELDDNDCVASVLAHNDEVDALVVDWAQLDPADLYDQACQKHQGDERVKFVPEIAEMLTAQQSKMSKTIDDRLDLSRLHLNELRLSPFLSVVTLCYDHLTELDLSRNLIDDVCLKMICKAGASVLGQLSKLDLSFNALTNVDAFVKVVDGHWRLRGLYLDFNFLQDTSSDSILRLIRRCGQLEQLGIGANGLTDKFFDPLQSWIQVLKTKPGMNVCVTKRNDISVEILEAIRADTDTRFD